MKSARTLRAASCDETVEADYVLVGLGTAGTCLAWGLSNNKHYSVYAIEGGADTLDQPPIFNADISDPAFTYGPFYWFYPANAALITTFGSIALYPMGRGWGGSSAVNYLLAVRGTPTPYDEWAADTGNPLWGYNNLLPTMKFLETFTPFPGPPWSPADPQQRGSKGPLFVTQGVWIDPPGAFLPPVDPANAYVQAVGSVGNAPYTTDYNNYTLGKFVTGDSQQYVTPTDHKRSWAASAFLGTDVVTRDDNGDGQGVGDRKLTISSDSTAISLLFEDDVCGCERSGCDCGCGKPRVRGVRFAKGGKIIDAIARKKVILSAGTMADVAVLQRSGIGPKALLDRLEIPVVVDSPNCGSNMQDHYGPSAFIPIKDADDNGGDPTLPITCQSFFDLGTGVRQFQSLTFGAQPDLTTDPPFPGGVFLNFWRLRPARVGKVELVTKAFPSDPLITFNFYTDPDDVDRAVEALNLAYDISMAYSGSPPYAPDPSLYLPPRGPATSDQGLKDYLLSGSSITNHNSGTCRMAKTIAEGVVDGNLDVFGVCGLSVCSNGVASTIEDGNTAWQAYILGLTKAKIEGGIVPSA